MPLSTLKRGKFFSLFETYPHYEKHFNLCADHMLQNISPQKFVFTKISNMIILKSPRGKNVHFIYFLV